jgi:hypothetical protein
MLRERERKRERKNDARIRMGGGNVEMYPRRALLETNGRGRDNITGNGMIINEHTK